MPLTKLHEICQRIANEKDPSKLDDLITQLENLLREEQEGIRSQIRSRISSMNGPI